MYRSGSLQWGRNKHCRWSLTSVAVFKRNKSSRVNFDPAFFEKEPMIRDQGTVYLIPKFLQQIRATDPN